MDAHSGANSNEKNPYNNAIQPAEPRPSHRLLAQTLRRCLQSLSLRAKAFSLVRRLIGRYTDKSKNEEIEEIRKRQYGLRLGESNEEMKTGNEIKQHIGGFRRAALIQMKSQSGLRLFGSNKDSIRNQYHRGVFRNVALIQMSDSIPKEKFRRSK